MSEVAQPSPETAERYAVRQVYLVGETGRPRIAWHWDVPGTGVDIAAQGFNGLYSQFSGRTLISTNAGQFLIEGGLIADVEACCHQDIAQPVTEVTAEMREQFRVPIAGHWGFGGRPAAFVHSVTIDTGQQVQTVPLGCQQMTDVFYETEKRMKGVLPPGAVAPLTYTHEIVVVANDNFL